MDSLSSFRRMTSALLIPVGTDASTFQVPDGFIKSEYTAFYVANPNQCWVGMRGTYSSAPDQQAMPALASPDGTDWVFAPGHIGVYSTQHPSWMSAIALVMPGWPLDGLAFTPLRISYGFGA